MATINRLNCQEIHQTVIYNEHIVPTHTIPGSVLCIVDESNYAQILITELCLPFVPRLGALFGRLAEQEGAQQQPNNEEPQQHFYNVVGCLAGERKRQKERDKS